MKLIASVCNKNNNYENRKYPGLLSINLQNEQISFLEFDSYPNYLSTTRYKDHAGIYDFLHVLNRVTGLTKYNGSFLGITAGSMPPSLFSFERQNSGKFKVTDVWAVVIADPHSIFCVGDYVWVAGSSANAIYEINLNKIVKAPYHEDPNNTNAMYSRIYHRSCTGYDLIHLNSICYHKSNFFISAFGEKTGEKWSSATNGYIKNLSTNEIVANVVHPHSLISYTDSIYFCESAKSSVRNTLGEKLELPESGYTRGLAIENNLLAVAASKSRDKSKSTGLVNNPADIGQDSQKCSIYYYDISKGLNNAQLLKSIDLTNYALEIFDLAIA